MADKLVVWQPVYFPKLHYLARLNEADVFVIFDKAEFSRQSRQHRAPIKFGGREWITIPVRHEGETKSIRQVRIDTSEYWWKTHKKTITAKYGGNAPAPFEDTFDTLELDQRLTLNEFTTPLLRTIIDLFDMDLDIVLSSEVDVDYEKGAPSQYLARITKHFECDMYYCGRNAYDRYLDPEPFEENGLEIEVQDWEPAWPEGNALCLDVLYNSEDPCRYIK